jgi:hypothetical protein
MQKKAELKIIIDDLFSLEGARKLPMSIVGKDLHMPPPSDFVFNEHSDPPARNYTSQTYPPELRNLLKFP